MRRLAAALAGSAVVAFGTASAAPNPSPVSSEPLRIMQYGLDRIQAERAWTRARGAGVAIAVVDSGVDMLHEDLRSKIASGHDFIDGDEHPQDANGHGTHVAGVAAAAVDNGLGIAGVAPATQLMPMRVLDERGNGSEANVASAIDMSVQRARGLGLRLVVNLSLTDVRFGGDVSSTRVQDTIRRAWQAGAVIVAAAGNESLPFGEYPAAGPNVIAVGATDDRNRRSSFSNRDPTVVAPGERIVGTYWDPSRPNEHDRYAQGSGTSMAAPFVAGVAALLLSSGLTNRQTVDRLVGSADDLGPRGRDEDFGYGLVNAARALGLPDAPGASSAAAPSLAARSSKFEEIAVPSPTLRAAPPARAGRDVPSASIAAGIIAATVLIGSLGSLRGRRSARR